MHAGGGAGAPCQCNSGRSQHGKQTQCLVLAGTNDIRNPAFENRHNFAYMEKLAYSLVAPAVKSRGNRVYVNEETVQMVTHYEHHHNSFNVAHKVASFTVNGQQERGHSYWKMNSDD